MQPYTITFKQHPLYLYVYVEGLEDSYEISKQYWMEAISKANELNYDKLLIHENIEKSVNLEEMFSLAIQFPKIVGDKKIAFVDEKLDQWATNEMGLYIAKNAGVNGNLFNNVQDAEKWLLKDSVE